MLRIWLASGDELAPVFAEKFRVGDLKSHLRAEHGFPVCLQRLVCDGACLKDEDEVTAPAGLQLVLSIDASNERQKREAQAELVSLVYYAAENGCVEAAQRVLQVCTDNGFYVCYSKALMVAARKGHTEIVRLLMDTGAYDLSRDNDRWTALLHAASGGQTEVVRLLLDAGANKDVSDGSGKSALMCAASAGHFDAARVLLDAGADKDVCDGFGMSALLLAAMNGHTEITCLLVDAGANKDRQDMQGGKTALMYAASAGHIDIARLLLDAGANKDVSDGSGKSALMCAASAWSL